MPSTRSNSSNSDSSKPRKTMTRRTRCVDLFNYSELEHCCQECKNTVDIHAKSRSKEAQCLQPWNQAFATTVARSLFHAKVCDCLRIESNAEIKDDFKCKNSKSTSDSSLSKSTNDNRNDLDNVNESIPTILKLDNDNKSAISDVSNDEKKHNKSKGKNGGKKPFHSNAKRTLQNPEDAFMAKQAIASSKHELKHLLQLVYPKVSSPQ